MTKIAVIGTGYVGLTTGACFAYLGHDVVCADIDARKIAMLNDGVIPIVESGLENLVNLGVKNNKLKFVVGAIEAARTSDVVFMCLPTPQREDGSADLSYVASVAEEISPFLKPNSIVVNKSTVPVGSAKIVSTLLGRSDVAVVSNPEFLREGTAVRDCLSPDRIVVGSSDADAAKIVAGLYGSLTLNVVITDAESAEMIKYASNAFLATKLSFVNAIASICEGTGASIDAVTRGMGLDNRIGRDFLKPGPGWGGSCFPKDSNALVKISSDAGYDFQLLKQVIQTNDRQLERVARKIKNGAGGSLSGKTVAVLGLTFKAGTDDLRDSPAVAIVEMLLDDGARVNVYDPTVKNARKGVPFGIEVCDSPRAAVDGADVLAVLTEWPEFSQIDPDGIYAAMRGTHVVDARNILDHGMWTTAGFTHERIGYR